VAKVPTKQRNSMPKSDFAEPKKRKYLIEDKSHAANAKARASAEFNKGKMSKGELEKIDRAADKELKKSKPKAKAKKKDCSY
jgi:hypothetical protein